MLTVQEMISEIQKADKESQARQAKPWLGKTIAGSVALLAASAGFAFLLLELTK